MGAPLVKYPYVSGVDWAFMRFMDIPDKIIQDRVYLRRLIIFKTPVFGCYLHWIYMPDSDRDPHNHPMNFWSLLLRGRYIERRFDRHRCCIGLRVRRPFTVARTAKTIFHQIEELSSSPTVTMLFTGRRSQDWGFLTEYGYVANGEYLASIGV